MQTGKFNILLDAFWGSSAKGAASTRLADHFSCIKVSSANLPNAGHTSVFEDGTKFIAKAIPTAAILKKTRGMGMECFISPGSGFSWKQLAKEWKESGKPIIRIHDRVVIVTEDHARREREGSESTMHIASTMQGSATAMVDKILRKKDCILARDFKQEDLKSLDLNENEQREFTETVSVLTPETFRLMSRDAVLDEGITWLHEGSQGYALSVDHGSHYPNCTSRNCDVQLAMDYMAMPPQIIGDVYLNLRSYPIRVGNVVKEGVQYGYSGDFYPDCKELTWEQVARDSGMPSSEAQALLSRELTTVTKRLRRVSTFSYIGLKDAVKTNGATKLIMNFIQYIDWKDAGLKGGREAFEKLSKKSRDFISKIEEVANVPVVMIGTGALHDEVISLL